jgi:hypothetical protein
MFPREEWEAREVMYAAGYKAREVRYEVDLRSAKDKSQSLKQQLQEANAQALGLMGQLQQTEAKVQGLEEQLEAKEEERQEEQRLAAAREQFLEMQLARCGEDQLRQRETIRDLERTLLSKCASPLLMSSSSPAFPASAASRSIPQPSSLSTASTLATAAQEAEAVGACNLLPMVAAPEEEEEEEEGAVVMGFVPQHLARRRRYAASLYGSGLPADTPVPSGRTSSHPEVPLGPITITPTRLSLLLTVS